MATKKKPTKKKSPAKKPKPLVPISITNNRFVGAEYSGMHAQAVTQIAGALRANADALSANADALSDLVGTLNGADVKVDCMLRIDTQ